MGFSGNTYNRVGTQPTIGTMSDPGPQLNDPVNDIAAALTTLKTESTGFAKSYADVAALQAANTNGQMLIVIDGAVWEYDATDTTTADDGVSCIVDTGGRRYKKQASLSDGDKGDIVVSGSGTVWTAKNLYSFATIAAAKSATIPASATSVTIIGRDSAEFVRWAAPMAAMYAELQDITWFDDAGAQRWMLKPGRFTTKMVGCAADGVTDDSEPLVACAMWMNAGWSRHLVVSDGVHITSSQDRNLSHLAASAWKTAMVAAAVSGVTDFQTSIPFVGLRNFIIAGEGGASIKMKDVSCVAASGATFNRMSWGLFNFMDCQDGLVTGVTFDGNRAGQTHTSAIVSGAVNHGCVVWGDCKRLAFRRNVFIRHGTLQTAGDKQGDGIYSRCGAEEISIDHNHFEDWGRWAVTLERGYPTPGVPTKGFYIRNNRLVGPFNEDGGVTLGAIDIESWQEWNSVHITDNVFSGSGTKISFGSTPDPAVQTCSDMVVERNTWDLRGYVSATVVTDNIIGIGASWGVITGSSVENTRRIRGARISDNTVIADKGFGHMIALTSALFDGLTVVGNRVQSDVASPDGYSLLVSSAAGVAGDWYISGNVAVGKNCIQLNSWQNTFDARPHTIVIDGNVSDNATRGFDIQAAGWNITAAGTITVTAGSTAVVGVGTLFRSELYVGQTITIAGSGESYRVAHIQSDTSARLSANVVTAAAASAYTRAAGLVDFRNNIAKRQSTTTGSTLTANAALLRYDARSCFLEGINTIAADVITPGLGVATVPNGAASVTIPHYCRADPVFMQAVSNGDGGVVARVAANANLGTMTITLQAAATADTPVSWMAHNVNGA